MATHRRTRYFAPQRMKLHDCAPILRGRPRGMHLLPPRVVLAALQLLPRLGEVDARAVHGLLQRLVLPAQLQQLALLAPLILPQEVNLAGH